MWRYTSLLRPRTQVYKDERHRPILVREKHMSLLNYILIYITTQGVNSLRVINKDAVIYPSVLFGYISPLPQPLNNMK